MTTGTHDARHWTEKLPKLPGPTFDTEYIRSPWTGLWLLVPKIPTYEDMLAELRSLDNIRPEILAKIDRANSETKLRGYVSHRRH